MSREEKAQLALLAAVLYFVVAQLVFAARHPWLTDMQRAAHMHRALYFGTVDHEEVR